MTNEQHLRIALVSEHASPLAQAGGIDAGGQNVYVAHVAAALARRGHRVDVLTRLDNPRLPAAVDLRPGVRVVHIPAGPAAFVPKEALLPHMPAFLRQARRLLAASVRYDVIHANFFMSGWVGLALARGFDLPMVMTFHALGLVRREHQGSADAFPARRIDIERRIVREADCIVAECPQDHADLVRLYGADAARLATVPCGVDVRAFAPRSRAAARRRLGIYERAFVVLQLGRMVPRTGVENVIRAMALLERRDGARVLVVGGETATPDDGCTPEIDRLRGVAAACGVGGLVEFTGRRDRADLPDCYAAADVFVTTPAYEPFGITPLEAMACGRPVIGSRVGGIQSSVADGVTGFLVPPNDPAALAARLDVLRANPALGDAMGRAGVRRVRALFTWEHVAAGLVAGSGRVAAPAATLPAPLHRTPAPARHGMAAGAVAGNAA